MMPHELKSRKKPPRTWSQAHRPPLGILDTSRTLGWADRTGSKSAPDGWVLVDSVMCFSCCGCSSTAIGPELWTESDEASDG